MAFPAAVHGLLKYTEVSRVKWVFRADRSECEEHRIKQGAVRLFNRGKL